MEQELVAWVWSHASMNGGIVPVFIEYLAVVVGVLGGATFACDRGMDIIGTICLGIITGFGGGIVRDVLLQSHGVYFTHHPYLVLFCAAVCVAVFYFRRWVRHLDTLVFLLDVLGVGLFAAAGANKALGCGSGTIMSMILGAITAVGGGALRDVFVGEPPKIFRPGEFYAIAGMAGATLYVLLLLAQVNEVVALVACVAVTTVLRYASVWFSWRTNADPRDEDGRLRGPAQRGRDGR